MFQKKLIQTLIFKATGFWVAVLVSLLYFASITATATEVYEGDEVETVMSYDTSKTDETPNQIEGVCQIPEGFGLNAYIELADDQGMHYYICVSQENGYVDRAYVKNGTYSFVSAGVFGDNTGKYTFDLVQGGDEFALDGQNNTFSCIKVKISNYDEIKNQIDTNKGEEKPKVVEYQKTGLNGVTIDSTGKLYYETKATSEKGSIEIYGNAIEDYNVYIEIIEKGVVGEAKFKLSLDGGNTFIGDDTTSDEFDPGSYGITIRFKTEVDTDELQVGDTFTANIPATNYVSQLNPLESNVVVEGASKEDCQLMIDILSSEALGKAKFSLSLDSGKSIEVTDTIPENGIYQYKDLTIYFYTIDEFSKGDQYMSSIESHLEKSSYAGIIILGAILIGVFIAFLVFLLMNSEKKTDYVIQVWNEKQVSEVYR